MPKTGAENETFLTQIGPVLPVMYGGDIDTTVKNHMYTFISSLYLDHVHQKLDFSPEIKIYHLCIHNLTTLS